MIELTRIIPEVEVLLALEPEELAAKILFLIRDRIARGDATSGMVNPGNFSNELWAYGHQEHNYPKNRDVEVELAIAEAVAWLRAQGLILAASGQSGNSGWCVLNRRARRFENESQFSDYSAARMLPRDLLHRRIRTEA